MLLIRDSGYLFLVETLIILGDASNFLVESINTFIIRSRYERVSSRSQPNDCYNIEEGKDYNTAW